MSNPNFAVVGRMEGLWPHQLAKIEMHRKRRGGDLGHVDRSRQNRTLVGGEDWVAETQAASRRPALGTTTANSTP